MKILLLACLSKSKSGNIFGGAEKSIVNLANWFSKGEHDVILVSVEGDAQPYYISNRVKYVSNKISSKSRIGIHMEIAKNTIIAIKQFQPDIIISFWIHPLFYALPLLLINKIPFYYSERNDPKKLYSRLSRFMRWIMIKFAKGIVFQTQEAMEYFDDSIISKSVVIHNPTYIKYEDFEFNTSTDNRVVSVGRLSEQKNFFLLIDGFEIISKEYSNLVLEIYGNGPLKEELQLYIREKELEGRVKLMGTCPNVIEKIYGAKVFVMTSDYEGMPNALIEAMCLGMTCLCTDCPCGGPRELITDNVNGYLFKVNDKTMLVDKLRYILTADNLQLRKNAKELCHTHNQEKIFSQWKEFLKITN